MRANVTPQRPEAKDSRARAVDRDGEFLHGSLEGALRRRDRVQRRDFVDFGEFYDGNAELLRQGADERLGDADKERRTGSHFGEYEAIEDELYVGIRDRFDPSGPVGTAHRSNDGVGGGCGVGQRPADADALGVRHTGIADGGDCRTGLDQSGKEHVLTPVAPCHHHLEPREID